MVDAGRGARTNAYTQHRANRVCAVDAPHPACLAACALYAWMVVPIWTVPRALLPVSFRALHRPPYLPGRSVPLTTL